MADDISPEFRIEVARRATVSRKHGGLSITNNVAYACILCNRHKGTDIASISQHTGDIVPLFHLRRDRWADHFRLDGEHITPISEIGHVTVRLLRLNIAERLAERRLLQSLGTHPV